MNLYIVEDLVGKEYYVAAESIADAVFVWNLRREKDEDPREVRHIGTVILHQTQEPPRE